jgi:hypothetical protein
VLTGPSLPVHRRVPDADAGVASAMVNTGQQIGTSIGTALLNTLAIAATIRYLTTRTLDGDRESRSRLGTTRVSPGRR